MLGPSSSKWRHRGKAPTVETALLILIQQSRENKAPLSGELLRPVSLQLHEETFKATNRWFDHFQRRSNLVYGALHGETDADQAACDKWVEDTWSTLIKDYTPYDIQTYSVQIGQGCTLG